MLVPLCKGETTRAGLSGFTYLFIIMYFCVCDIFGGTFMFASVWMKKPLDYILTLDITVGLLVICNFAFIKNYRKQYLL